MGRCSVISLRWYLKKLQLKEHLLRATHTRQSVLFATLHHWPYARQAYCLRCDALPTLDYRDALSALRSLRCAFHDALTAL